MNKSLFNTVFEISLRTLLVLETSPRESASVDKLAAVDFMATYGKEFSLSETNLHGNGFLKYSEFTHRRSLVQQAIKRLAIKGYVVPELTHEGFSYLLTNKGKQYCDSLSGKYPEEYRALCEKVWVRFPEKTEQELINMINVSANSSIFRKEDNDGSVLP